MTESRNPLTLLRTPGQSRRTVLKQAGLAAVAIGAGTGLAGCAGGPSAQGSASPSEAPGTSSSPSSGGSPSASGSPSSGDSPSASGSASQAPPQGISVAAADVPEGGGIVVQEKYVVTQPSAGEYKAFSAICTHQGCPVERVQDSEIVCPCHGSRFAFDTGQVVGGPAEEPLPSVEFTESGDTLVLPE